jgi:hypothetical protein
MPEAPGPRRRNRAARSPGEIALAAEAAFCLVWAGLAIRILPFAAVARLAGRKPLARPRTPGQGVVAHVGWAVEAAARRAPWPVLCFERGLAAHAILRRRGLDSTLIYGARGAGARGPEAHVWVRLGDQVVVGGEAAAGFATLATFPSRQAGRPAAGPGL